MPNKYAFRERFCRNLKSKPFSGVCLQLIHSNCGQPRSGTLLQLVELIAVARRILKTQIRGSLKHQLLDFAHTP